MYISDIYYTEQVVAATVVRDAPGMRLQVAGVTGLAVLLVAANLAMWLILAPMM